VADGDAADPKWEVGTWVTAGSSTVYQTTN
jgi:hypothetical protein